MDNQTPLVSVILPNFNHEGYLPKRLETIFNQTLRDFELILLDDASTDHSVGLLESAAKSDDRVTHAIFNRVNSGSTFSQWKKGIQLARADLIWIAESDDFSDLFFLEKVSAPLIQNRQVGLSYCQSWKVNAKGENRGSELEWTADLHPTRWKSEFTSPGIGEIANYLVKKNTIPNASAVVFRKSLFPLEVSIERFKQSGDVLVWSSIIRDSLIHFVPEHLNYFRHHPQTVRHALNYSVKLRDNLDFLATVSEWGIKAEQIQSGLDHRLPPILARLYQDSAFTQNMGSIRIQIHRFNHPVQVVLFIRMMSAYLKHLSWKLWQWIKKNSRRSEE